MIDVLYAVVGSVLVIVRIPLLIFLLFWWLASLLTAHLLMVPSHGVPYLVVCYADIGILSDAPV